MKRKPRHGKSVGCRFTPMGRTVRATLAFPMMEKPKDYCDLMAEFARLDPCAHLDCQPCAAKPMKKRCGACRIKEPKA
jgi:hypothetical protein